MTKTQVELITSVQRRRRWPLDRVLAGARPDLAHRLLDRMYAPAISAPAWRTGLFIWGYRGARQREADR